MTLVRQTRGLGTYEDPRTRVIEKRDPTAATQAVVYQSPGQPQIPNWDAQRALSFGFYANTFVYRCIQCIAQDLSGLAIRVGADRDKPADFDVNAPLARLLGPPPGGPNVNTSARQLVAWTVAQYLATGRWGWELELGTRDEVAALWPLPASYLKAIPTQGGARYWSKFTFGKPGEERTLMPDRVFYHWRPRQDDWRQPESALDAGRYDISVAVMQDRYDVAFLRNDARPAAVVIYEGFATEDEDRSFRRDFNHDFGGPDNAGKVMFTEADRDESGSVAGALDIKVLGLNAKEARMVERYAAKLQAITALFGVPMSRLGDASGRTFSNASEEWKGYYLTTIRDLAHEFEDAVNIGLAPRFGSNVMWFDFSKVELLKAPKKFTIAEGIDLVKIGAITRDELRIEADLPEMGLTELTVFEPPVETPALEQPERAVDEPEHRSSGDVPAPAPPLRAQPLPAGPTSEQRAAMRRSKAVIASTVQVEGLERTWKRAFARLFARQKTETLRRLEGKRGRQALREIRAPEPDAIFKRSHWRSQTEEDSIDLIEAVFAAGGGRIAAEFGVGFDVAAPYVQQFIKARANQLAGLVTDTTYDQITTALADGTAAGETIPEIADRVRAVFDQATTVRSETIARTEVISAYNGSAATVAAQLPGDVVGGQEWITVEDSRTRPEHAAADGEIVNIGEAFTGTGESLAYPGDPSGSPGNIINCRCTIAFLTPDEMSQRTARVQTRTVLAVLAMVRPGEYDEIAVRRALREGRAA